MSDDLLISKREILAVLFRHLVGILLIFFTCVGGAAFAVYYLISPNYQAEAVIIFNSSLLTEPLRDAPSLLAIRAWRNVVLCRSKQ